MWFTLLLIAVAQVSLANLILGPQNKRSIETRLVPHLKQYDLDVFALHKTLFSAQLAMVMRGGADQESSEMTYGPYRDIRSSPRIAVSGPQDKPIDAALGVHALLEVQIDYGRRSSTERNGKARYGTFELLNGYKKLCQVDVHPQTSYYQSLDKREAPKLRTEIQSDGVAFQPHQFFVSLGQALKMLTNAKESSRCRTMNIVSPFGKDRNAIVFAWERKHGAKVTNAQCINMLADIASQMHSGADLTALTFSLKQANGAKVLLTGYLGTVNRGALSQALS